MGKICSNAARSCRYGLNEFQAGGAFVSIELMAFLKDWLEKHIQVTDMQYSPYLSQRKVA